MSPPNKSRSDQPLLHTVEEATELLRRVDVRAWVWWFGGTLPFVLVLLHYWTEMSRSSLVVAKHDLPAASLVLALSYWWMKIAQSVFGDHLLRYLRDDESPPSWPWRGKVRFVTSQALIHFTTPWLLTLASAAILPFAWVYAFYHNALILAPGHFRNGGRTRELVRLAMAQSNYRARHNHGVLTLLSLASMLVWINFFSGTYTLATMLYSFTGDDNAITRNPLVMFSSGVLAATAAAAYVLVGPLVKSAYALRCFYGLSRKNGEDILVAFRRSAAPLLVAFALGCGSLHASNTSTRQTPPTPAQQAPAPHLDANTLDKRIHEVLQRDVFQWRMPRDSRATDKAEAKSGGFAKAVSGWIKHVVDSAGNMLEGGLKRWFKSLFEGDGDKKPDDLSSAAPLPWANIARNVLIGLAILLCLTVIVLLIKQWRRLPPAAAAPVQAIPEVDLESENVMASALPENEWLRLAQEKMDAGDYRLAMRALFLATLAHLGDRKLLRIVRSKSNGDYVRELALRARDRDEMRGRFTDSVRVFDWAWYGWHDVTRELLDQFRDHYQHIIADGPA